MTSALLQELLKQVAVLGIFLMIGMYLRSKVPFFRKMLLPASVIGGFLALVLGPNVWANSPLISPEYVSVWSILPGVLIVPIFAAVPLGKGMGEEKKTSLKKNLPRVMISAGLFSANGGIQAMIGFGFTLIAMKVMPSLNLYRIFGVELGQGYSGGHGTAAGLGSILQGYGLDYWEVSQGVATTYATIGLVGGMLMGIYFINRAARNGETKILKKPGELPMDTQKGFSTDISKQGNIGRETTHSSSIETISVHLALILADSALAYYLLGLAKAHNVFGLSSIPVWFYALLQMYAINAVLKLMKLDWMIDSRVKARITGSMSDFAILAAIASMPIKAVAAYVVPIIIIATIGFITTYFFCFPLFKWCFGKKDFPFERAIISWGVNTGVMINGMMLLKICDPEYDSPALNDFSMGFAMMSIVSIFTSPVFYGFLQSGTTLQNFLWALTTTTGYTILFLVGRYLLKKAEPENFEE